MESKLLEICGIMKEYDYSAEEMADCIKENIIRIIVDEKNERKLRKIEMMEELTRLTPQQVDYWVIKNRLDLEKAKIKEMNIAEREIDAQMMYSTLKKYIEEKLGVEFLEEFFNSVKHNKE